MFWIKIFTISINKVGSALNIEDILKSNKFTTVRGAPLHVFMDNFEGGKTLINN